MKIANGTLVMAVDGRKMVLLRNEGDVRRPLLRTVLEHEDVNPRSALQGTDRPGRTFSRMTPRRSSLKETDWHEEAKDRFPLAALQKLDNIESGDDARIILLAAPPALGEIRKHYSDRLKTRIIAEIDKDVVNHMPEDIVKVISAYEP